MGIYENKAIKTISYNVKLRIQRKNQSFPVASLLILLNLPTCAITFGSESESLFVPWNCVFFQKGGTASCQKTSGSTSLIHKRCQILQVNRTTQPVPGFLIGAALIPQVPEHVCMNHFEPLKGPVFQIVLRICQTHP